MSLLVRKIRKGLMMLQGKIDLIQQYTGQYWNKIQVMVGNLYYGDFSISDETRWEESWYTQKTVNLFKLRPRVPIWILKTTQDFFSVSCNYMVHQEVTTGFLIQSPEEYINVNKKGILEGSCERKK